MSALPQPLQRSSKPRRGEGRLTTIAARGEPFVWLVGAGLAASLLMIIGLLLLITVQGLATFWPAPVVELTLNDGSKLMGQVVRRETFVPQGSDQPQSRRLVRRGNTELYGDDFKWVKDSDVASERRPQDAWLIERKEWGIAVGFVRSVSQEGKTVVDASTALKDGLGGIEERERDRSGELMRLERDEAGSLNLRLERGRMALKRIALKRGEASAEYAAAKSENERTEATIRADYDRLQSKILELRAQQQQTRLVFEDAMGALITGRPGSDQPMLLAQVVRAVPINKLNLLGRLELFGSRWWEYLHDVPREANTEGGVFPAIFGTLIMTVLMSAIVAPLGVIAALYLREYAKAGPIVSTVRIAINNLAGVPSIVFGVFGLGFFCYGIGGTIDRWFFPEALPSPTFGTGGILWASLTMALMTVPVVIITTEEAIAAVPRSMREGSLACGASRWQTIQRIVLPRAMPGIMTGLILAMARGAGEVAPLMLTGVVKLAPHLPFDATAPFLHLERSFMHLGFQIFDVGFQSRNSEAAKPMVFTASLLLIVLVVALNLSAIRLRARLRARFKSATF